MSDNKLVKTIIDATTLTGQTGGIGWVANKAVKENFTFDPRSSAMNYVKFTAVMASSIALKSSPTTFDDFRLQPCLEAGTAGL